MRREQFACGMPTPVTCSISCGVKITWSMPSRLGLGAAVMAVDRSFACAIVLGTSEFRLYNTISRMPRVFKYRDIDSLEVRRGRQTDFLRIVLKSKHVVQFFPSENGETQLALHELRTRLTE